MAKWGESYSGGQDVEVFSFGEWVRGRVGCIQDGKPHVWVKHWRGSGHDLVPVKRKRDIRPVGDK